MTAARWTVGAATTAFAAALGALAVLQHRAFETGRFDLGNLVQTIWSTANGDLLELTGLAGEQISRLGAHFDPIVVVFAPLWWLWPDPELLLVCQAVAVALGALPVFALARRHLGSEWVAAGFAGAYLLYSPTQWLVLDDFHPVALATPLLLGALLYLDAGRLVPFAVLAGLACLTKEHIGLVVASYGIWFALSRRRVRAGLTIAACGTMVSVVAIAVVVPHFAPGGGSPFAGRYAGVGGTPTGIAQKLVTDPGAVLSALTEGRDLGYVLDLLVPLAFLPLLAPVALVTVVPELLVNLLSSTRTQTSIHFHYTAGAIPGLMLAAILGARRLGGWWPSARRAVGWAVPLVALVAGIAYGPLPMWRHVPFGETLAARDHVVTRHDRVAERALRLIPPEAAVSATNTLGAHLSERRRVFSFPVLREARWVAVDTTRFSSRDQAVAPVEGLRAYRRLRDDARWQAVFSEDGIVVLHRR